MCSSLLSASWAVAVAKPHPIYSECLWHFQNGSEIQDQPHPECKLGFLLLHHTPSSPWIMGCEHQARNLPPPKGSCGSPSHEPRWVGFALAEIPGPQGLPPLLFCYGRSRIWTDSFYNVPCCSVLCLPAQTFQALDPLGRLALKQSPYIRLNR